MTKREEPNVPATRLNSPIALTSMSEAMELAKMMANSTLVPREFQKQPSNCLLVIMQAIRWEMDPFAVIQHTSVISGRPMYNGQLVAAVVNTRGNLRKSLNYAYGTDKEGRYVIVSGQRRSDEKPKEVRVDLKKVVTNNVQWTKQPDQQLAYHGARVWARRWVPELMLGVYSREEFPDDGNQTAVEEIDLETGEVKEENRIDIADYLIGAMWECRSEQQLEDYLEDHKKELDGLMPPDKERVRNEYRRVKEAMAEESGDENPQS